MGWTPQLRFGKHVRYWLDLLVPGCSRPVYASPQESKFWGNARVTPLPRASVDLLSGLRWAWLLIAGDSTSNGLQISTWLPVSSGLSPDCTPPRSAIVGEERQPQSHQSIPPASSSIPTMSQMVQIPAWRHGDWGNEPQTGPPVDGITHYPTLTEARQLQAEQIVPSCVLLHCMTSRLPIPQFPALFDLSPLWLSGMGSRDELIGQLP